MPKRESSLLPSSLLNTSITTMIALIAFSANSVLCRLALSDGAIDAGSFTIIRLLSGALMLIVLMFLSKMRGNNTNENSNKGSWFAGLMLFFYAVAFSFAYISLDTATGALVLFAAVQTTLIYNSFLSGNRLQLAEFIGLVIAFLGVVYLLLPGLNEPPIIGTLLMALAGICWGMYTVKGQGSANALFDTGYNFIRSLVFVIPLVLIGFNTFNYTRYGVLLALISGAITSGLGYTIWYVALKDLRSVQAGVLQLLVPVITALGGIVFMSEPITYRLSISMVLIIGGILLVILNKNQNS